MGLNHTVQAFVKRSRRIITSPVVVFPVCISKEVSTKHREVSRSGSSGGSGCFVQSTEVVRQSPKLSLKGTGDKTERQKEMLTQTEQRKSSLSLVCMGLFSYTASSEADKKKHDSFCVLSASLKSSCIILFFFHCNAWHPFILKHKLYKKNT